MNYQTHAASYPAAPITRGILPRTRPASSMKKRPSLLHWSGDALAKPKVPWPYEEDLPRVICSEPKNSARPQLGSESSRTAEKGYCKSSRRGSWHGSDTLSRTRRKMKLKGLVWSEARWSGRAPTTLCEETCRASRAGFDLPEEGHGTERFSRGQ